MGNFESHLIRFPVACHREDQPTTGLINKVTSFLLLYTKTGKETTPIVPEVVRKTIKTISARGFKGSRVQVIN